MNLKIWKGIYEYSCWDRALVLRKKILPGRGLTKVGKHWYRKWHVAQRLCIELNCGCSLRHGKN